MCCKRCYLEFWFGGSLELMLWDFNCGKGKGWDFCLIVVRSFSSVIVKEIIWEGEDCFDNFWWLVNWWDFVYFFLGL